MLGGAGLLPAPDQFGHSSGECFPKERKPGIAVKIRRFHESVFNFLLGEVWEGWDDDKRFFLFKYFSYINSFVYYYYIVIKL